MARDGDMPRTLARTTTQRKTPWLAALTLYAGACVLLPLGEVRIVASISALGILIVFVGVHAAVIVLRFKAPGQERPFRVPLRIGRPPLLPPLGVAISLALITQFEPAVADSQSTQYTSLRSGVSGTRTDTVSSWISAGGRRQPMRADLPARHCAAAAHAHSGPAAVSGRDYGTALEDGQELKYATRPV